MLFVAGHDHEGRAAQRTAAQAGARGLDTVLVSVSAGANLDLAAKLVKFIRMIHRDAPLGAPPVIVGGAILQSGVDVKALTGADHVTSDPLEALRFCGIGDEGERRHQRA